jgi:hypothetical protein
VSDRRHVRSVVFPLWPFGSRLPPTSGGRLLVVIFDEVDMRRRVLGNGQDTSSRAAFSCRALNRVGRPRGRCREYARPGAKEEDTSRRLRLSAVTQTASKFRPHLRRCWRLSQNSSSARLSFSQPDYFLTRIRWPRSECVGLNASGRLRCSRTYSAYIYCISCAKCMYLVKSICM